jgi:hypothetical protein
MDDIWAVGGESFLNVGENVYEMCDNMKTPR